MPGAAVRTGAVAQIVDHRPGVTVQRELMDIARTSPKLIAQARLTDAIRHSPTMAIQREQVGVMRGASVPRRGRPEADVSSAGALASVPPRVSALPFDRASRTFPTALPAAWQSVAQLVNLPPDSFGKLEDIKLDMGEGEITARISRSH